MITLVGFDQDLAAEATRTSNGIRGLLTQFHPSLERVLGPRLGHPAVTWLLERHGSPLVDDWGPEKIVVVSHRRTGMKGVLVIDNTARGVGNAPV